MGMYDNIKDVFEVFYKDETLLRLLHYRPLNYFENRPDPLDPSLDNILDIDKLGEIRNEHIKFTSKSSDLEQKEICRIYLYAGRRKPKNDNFLLANQEVVIDIFCHNNFEEDLRSVRIGDRLNELLVSEKITGITKMSYVDGYPINSPLDYVGYKHIYRFESAKK